MQIKLSRWILTTAMACGLIVTHVGCKSGPLSMAWFQSAPDGPEQPSVATTQGTEIRPPAEAFTPNTTGTGASGLASGGPAGGQGYNGPPMGNAPSGYDSYTNAGGGYGGGGMEQGNGYNSGGPYDSNGYSPQGYANSGNNLPPANSYDYNNGGNFGNASYDRTARADIPGGSGSGYQPPSSNTGYGSNAGYTAPTQNYNGGSFQGNNSGYSQPPSNPANNFNDNSYDYKPAPSNNYPPYKSPTSNDFGAGGEFGNDGMASKSMPSHDNAVGPSDLPNSLATSSDSYKPGSVRQAGFKGYDQQADSSNSPNYGNGGSFQSGGSFDTAAPGNDQYFRR